MSWDEINRFKTNGYLQITGLVPQYKMDACLRVLNHHLGLPDAITDGGVQKGLGKLSGKLTAHPSITELLTDSAFRYVEKFLGAGNVVESCFRPQIAMRFPEIHEINYTNNRIWHTDPYRQGHYHNFSLIVGICLTDVQYINSGNLCVWPGSHSKIFRCKDHSAGSTGDIHFEELSKLYDCSTLYKSAQTSSNQGGDDDHDDYDNNNDQNNNVQDMKSGSLKRDGSEVPDIGPPVQLLTRAGDVIFCHPDLAHCGGLNTSSHIRSMVYFRIKSKLGSDRPGSTDRNYQREMNDLYFDLPGISGV